LTNKKQELPMVAMFAKESERNEKNLDEAVFRREDSNVKNKQTTDDGRHVMAEARMAFRPSELKMEECFHRIQMASFSAKVDNMQEHKKDIQKSTYLLLFYAIHIS
jgi:hypothetical protein